MTCWIFGILLFALIFCASPTVEEEKIKVKVVHSALHLVAQHYTNHYSKSLTHHVPYQLISSSLTEGSNKKIAVELLLAPTNCPKDNLLYGRHRRVRNRDFFTCRYNAEDDFVQVQAVIISKPVAEDSYSVVINSWRPVPLTQQMLDTPDHLLLGKEDDYSAAFIVFTKHYKKAYAQSSEHILTYMQRYLVFRKNMRMAKLLQMFDQGTAIYGATMFADLTQAEFKQKLGLRANATSTERNKTSKSSAATNKDLPASFDWREHGAVTEVKNQGGCGSCWAFSVTGNIEGQWYLAKNQLLSLSEQQLVDCDKADQGCNGGLPWLAYEQIVGMGGLQNETQYPYHGRDEACHLNKSEELVTIRGAVNITQDEAGIQEWLYAHGPISAGLNALPLQFYFGGVSHPPKAFCSPEGLDHGVLIVGYGVHTTWLLRRKQPYWIVKNSWGTGWGEKGYFRMYRGDGTCGINTLCSSAQV